MARAGFALILVLLGAPAMAEVTVSFPLQGYWRAGRYMPVRVVAKVGGSSLEIGAEGAVPVRVELRNGRVDAVVPVLVMSEPRAMYWKAEGGESGVVEQRFKQLGAQQRLVGFTPALDSVGAGKLFAGDSIIPIELPSIEPLRGPAVAWETLDAVSFDGAVSREQFEDLSACGVILLRNGEAKKTPRIIGPRGAGEDAGAFAAVQGWHADWPPAFRRAIMLMGVIVAIVVLAVGLMRFKYSALVLVLLCGVASAGVWMWWRDRPAVLTKGGLILCHAEGMTQADLWMYQASASGSESLANWFWVTYPHFESKEDRLAMKPVLVCAQDGKPRGFTFRLLAGQKIGFCMRSTWALPKKELRQEVSSPLAHLARRMYLREGLMIAGETDSPVAGHELPDYGEQWPTLVIEAQRK